MKRNKIAVIFVLAILMLVLAACGSAEDTPTASNQSSGSHGEVDWSIHPIIIDNEIGVAANWHTAAGSDFPTHIPLLPVAYALGTAVTINDSSVTLEGRNGTITFTVGAVHFNVDGRNVELWQPSLLVDGEIYVPIPFFRDVFGMGSAMWMSGHVHLDTYATGDMH